MRLLFTVTVLLLVSGASLEDSDKAPSKYFVQEMLVRAQNHLTADLYKVLSRDQGNLVVSPWSIMSLLTAAYILAGGRTASEIEEHLKIPLLSRKELFDGFHYINNVLSPQNASSQETIESIGAAFLGNGLHAPDRVQKILQQHLNTYINHYIVTDGYNDLQRNFTSSLASSPEKAVNDLVVRKTRGLIPELLPPGTIRPNQTALWLFNVLYYQGAWKHKFQPHSTHRALFKVDGDFRHQVDVPTMMLEAQLPMTQYPDYGMNLLELPYGQDGHFALYILLPDKDDGLPALEKNLRSHKRLHTVLSEDHWLRLVKVFLPKFKFHKETDLAEAMWRMGFKRMFQPGEADFSRLRGTCTESAYVSEMGHKAVIEVTEDGTRAAAVTSLRVSARRFAYHFKADHPFMFVLRDKQLGINLFVGRVTDPRELS